MSEKFNFPELHDAIVYVILTENYVVKIPWKIARARITLISFTVQSAQMRPIAFVKKLFL